MRGTNIERVREYVLKEERDSSTDERTTFLYRYLDAETMWDMQDELMQYSVPRGAGADDDSDVKTSVFHGRNERKALLKGLVGYRNVYDEDGVRLPDVENADQTQKKLVLSMMTATQRTELSSVILRSAKLTEKQKGESPSQPGLLSIAEPAADAPRPAIAAA